MRWRHVICVRHPSRCNGHFSTDGDQNHGQGIKKEVTDKQKRQAEHIEEGYEKRGTSKKEAERRAWATVNKESGGGKKSGSGRGKKKKKASAKKGGKKGGKKGVRKRKRVAGKKVDAKRAVGRKRANRSIAR